MITQNRTALSAKKAVTLTVLLLACLLLIVSCGKNTVTDYSADSRYAALFTEEDTPEAKEMKNVVIDQFEAYNKGDAEGYYALFDMTKEDLQYNVAAFRNLRTACTMSDTIEEINTAFVNEENGQALITHICRAENTETGELLYYYRTETTYTMVKTDGVWKITLQTHGAEEDLTGLEASTDTAQS